MVDPDFEAFSIRSITRGEWSQRADYTRNMLFASAAASLAIVGAGAFFLSLWF